MEVRIETLKEKKLIGKRLTMTYANNKTHDLWKGFMPRRKEIKNLNSELISMQVYDESFNFVNFDINKNFEKWATIEVLDFEIIPAEMEAFTLVGGPYAVFLYKGDASGAVKAFQYIFGTWLPGSVYSLDHRPHFEILGEKYKNGDPDSEEEIWIPIKLK